MADGRGRERFASLMVISQEMEVDEISAIAGVSPDRYREIGSVREGAPRRIPATETSWELVEHADGWAPLSDLIDKLSERVLPLGEGLVALRHRGCSIKLELVHWISPSDPVGSGFVLDDKLVKLLAAIDAFVDVDQFLDSD